MNQQMHELVLNFPYPLSSVVLEVLKLGERWESGETVPNLPFDICRAGGLLLRTNAAVSIAAFLFADQNIPELNSEVVSSLRSPADGTWLNLTQRLLRSLKLDLPLFKTLGEALNRKVEIPQAVVPGEDTFEISAKDKKAKAKKITIRDMLSQLIKYRNKVAHGDHLTNRDHADALAKLRTVVGGHEFYTKYKLLVRDGKRWLSFDGPGVQELGEDHNDPDWWTGSFKTVLADFPDRVVTIIKVHPETDIDDSLQLTPLLHYSQIDEGDILFSDIFFVNRGTADAAEYIAYHYEGHVSADGIGSYKAFREMIQQLPTPPIPKEKRLEFDGLAEFHAQRFVGREDVLCEIKEVLHQTDVKYIELRALAGMGKTAILTRLYMEHGIAEHLPWPGANKKTPRPLPVDQDRWAFHFCMPTDGRDDPMVALQSIVCQLCDGAGLQRKQYLANEMEQQQKKMVKLLGKVTDQLEREARVIICIDALDEGIPNYGTHSVPNVLIGESEDDYEKSTGMELPDGVIFFVSYRVDDEGASRVDAHLEHIPEEWRQRLNTADPLKGLTKDDVSLLLNRLAGEAHVPEASEITLDTIWNAATRDTVGVTGANPFFLRFIGDGVLEGDVDLSRPESIPADLGSLFEQTWMSLPSESNYALHRILGTLAILQEYGTDELMLEVVNASLPKKEVLALSDLRSLRAKAGKLLVYDGDRYGLFHDRFRWFLIGRPSDRLDMALSRYEKLDSTGRFGPQQVAKLHGALADMAERWDDSGLSRIVRDYILHYGPHHQIMAGQVQDAVRSLIDYPRVNERLKSNRGNEWVEDLQIIKWANENGLKIENLNLFRHWEDFARENRHIIDRGNDEWPANKILLQLAVEHSDRSPVTQAAEKWLDKGFFNWPWLRKFGRCRAQMLSPVLQVFEGHKPVLGEDKIQPEYGYGIVDAFMLDDNRLVSYAVADPCIRVWDIQTGKVLKRFRDKNFPGLGVDDALCDVAKWDKDTILFLFNDDLMMWDVSSGETIKYIKIPLYKNWYLERGLIIGQKEDDSICVFDIKKEAVVFECNWKNGCDYRYLSTGKLVICNDQDPSIQNRTKRMQIWDLQSKKLMYTVKEVDQPNHFIQITDEIFAVSEKKWTYVINADTGEIKKLAGHRQKILGMFKTKNMLCTWSQDGWLGVWDIKTYEKLHFVKAHEDIISINMLEEDTDLAISFSEDSTKVWKLEKGESTEYDNVWAIENAYGNFAGVIDRDSEYGIDIKVTVIPLLDSCICFAKAYSTNPETDRDKELINRGFQWISLFSGDGSMGDIPSHENGISGYLKTNSGDLITWGEDNRLEMISQNWGDIWTRQLDEAEDAGNLDELIDNNNDEAARIKMKDLQFPNIVPLSENRIVIYEYDKRGMILWNPIKREIESIIDTDEPETPNEIHVQDEKTIFVEYETKIKKWNMTTKEDISFEGHEEVVCDFFVINKDRIATKDALDIYRIWNSSTGECLLRIKNISEFLEQSLNESGEFLCSSKKKLVLIDGKDAKIIRRFPGYSDDAVITCAAIPDQRWLISSNEDKKIRLWGRDNRKCLAVFDNHKVDEFENISSEEFVQMGKEHYLSFSPFGIKLLNIDNKSSVSLGFEGEIDIDGYCIYPDLRILIWGYDFYSGEMFFRLCNGITGQVYKEIGHKISGTGFELKYYLDKLVARYSDVIEVMNPDTLELDSVSEEELEKYSKPFLTDKDQFCFILENRIIFRNPGSYEMLQWHSDKIKSDVGDLKAWENGSVSFDSQFLQLYYGSKPVLSRIKWD